MLQKPFTSLCFVCRSMSSTVLYFDLLFLKDTNQAIDRKEIEERSEAKEGVVPSRAVRALGDDDGWTSRRNLYDKCLRDLSTSLYLHLQ